MVVEVSNELQQLAEQEVGGLSPEQGERGRERRDMTYITLYM